MKVVPESDYPVPDLPPGVDLSDHSRAQAVVNACMVGYSRMAEQNRGVPPCSPRALMNAMLITAGMTMTTGDPLDDRATFLAWAATAYDYAEKVRNMYATKEPSDA